MKKPICLILALAIVAPGVAAAGSKTDAAAELEVELLVTVGDEWARVVTRNGLPARIEDQHFDAIVELVASIEPGSSLASPRVAVQVYRVLRLRDGSAGELRTLAGVTQLSPGSGAAAASGIGFPMQLEVLSVALADGPRPSSLRPRDFCCMSCGGTTVCGCGVWMSCGSCCVAQCCE